MKTAEEVDFIDRGELKKAKPKHDNHFTINISKTEIEMQNNRKVANWLPLCSFR